MSWRRASPSSAASRPGRSAAGRSSASALRWKPRPSTAARSTTARSFGGSASMRAASSAWMDGGRPAVAAGAHGDDLLEEEGVSLGGGEHAPGVGRGDPRAGRELREQLGRVVVRERAEGEDRAARARAGDPSALEQLRARQADEQQRDVPRERRHMVEQVEQRRLGPVDVVDDDDQRPVGGADLEQPADRPVGLVGRDGARGDADDARDVAGDRLRLVVARAAISAIALTSGRPASRRTISASGQYVMPSP